MADFQFQEMVPHGEDTTPYRRIEGDWVSADTFRGESILLVDPAAVRAALMLMTERSMG